MGRAASAPRVAAATKFDSKGSRLLLGYKNYIFSELFLKRLSDRFDEETEKAMADGIDRSFAETNPDEHEFFVPPESRSPTLVSGSMNLGEKLNKACFEIEAANAPQLDGVPRATNWNDDSKLGSPANRDRIIRWNFCITANDSDDGPLRRERIKSAIISWYQQRAVERLEERVKHWSMRLEIKPRRVLVANQRQRWGSCSPDRTLRFNWRLVMVEPTLLDYVIVHELVHLRDRTHAAAFWESLARVLPDYKVRRARLKEAGRRLSL